MSDQTTTKPPVTSAECYERAGEALTVALDKIRLAAITRADAAVKVAKGFTELGKVYEAQEVAFIEAEIGDTL